MAALVDEEGTGKKSLKGKAGSFQGLGLEANLLNGLNRMGYKVPTPVQRKTLPLAMAGMDAVVMARTGSGKTGAFLVPMLHRLGVHESTGGIRAIALSPTRELAVQTYRFAKDMAKFTDIRIASVIGGEPLEKQFEALSMRPDMLVGTPGRLMHHLREISTLKLKTVKYLVFDEADRLFEMGFAEQLNEIIKECPEERQTMLFSATMPKQLIQFTRAGLRDPQLVRLDSETKMSEELRMAFFTVRSNEKVAALLYLVRRIIPAGDMTIIFTATKHHSEYIHALFTKIGVKSIVVYGTMDQAAREERLKAFRKGAASYLIVTDLAARGIDIPLLNNVINLHFPMNPKLFVHRCGRAARQGRIGYAMSLVEPEELAHMGDVYLFLGKEVVNSYSANAPGGMGGSGEEVVVGKGNGKSNVSGKSTVPLSSHTQGYTLSDMTPDMVHVGALPQIVLDQENEFVKRTNREDEAVQMASQIADNGMKAYRRTRSEASHHGVSLSKKLIKEERLVNIHPLIAGEDPDRCSKNIIEQANFIRVLQTFRPGQTILEGGAGHSTGSQMAKHEARAKTKGGRSGGSTSTIMSSHEDTHGGQVMKEMRKVAKHGLLRNKEATHALYSRLEQDMHTSDQRVEQEHGDGVSRTGPSVSTIASSGAAKIEARKKKEKSSPAWLDAMEAEAEDLHAGSVGESDDDHSPATAAVESSGGGGAFAVEKVNKARMSAAERRKVKKKGAGGSSEVGKGPSNGNDCGVTISGGGGSGGGGSTFKDMRYYMSYGVGPDSEGGSGAGPGADGASSVTSPDAAFREATLQPQAGLRTVEARQVAMMESALLSVSQDEALALNKQKRIMRWDAKKKKFVKQSLAEIDELKGSSRGKRQRGEMTKSKGKGKLEQGEMYAKWSKRTRREVNSAAVAAGDDPDADRPIPNVKSNLQAKNELLTEDQMRKKEKERENNRLKNLPKAQRRAVEGAARKKKAQEAQSRAPKIMHKAARKKIKVIVR